MISKPLDFFERRSGRLFFDPSTLQMLKEPILKEFSNYFAWDKDTFDKEKEVLEIAFKQITKFE